MPKTEKKAEKNATTTAEFVKRMNTKGSKLNGSKVKFSWKR